jgi:tetratricopeptide (TPR) repeat protein
VPSVFISDNTSRSLTLPSSSNQIEPERREAAASLNEIRRIDAMRQWIADHKALCFCIAAAVWVLVLYSGVFSAPFVYDDLDQVANNTALQSWHAVYTRFLLAPVTFTSGFLGNGGSTYRPVFWMSLALDRHLWGNDASGFHATNLLLHWLNGVLLFQLMRRLRLSSVVAAGAALAWLGLPILSESVAWISARAYPLSTAFMLLAAIAALAYVRKGNTLSLAAFIASSLLANFSHEQGCFLGLFLALGYSLGAVKQQPRRWMLLGAISLTADALYVACKYAVGAHAGQGSSTLWAVGLTFWNYLQLIVLPIHMSIERSSAVPANIQSAGAVAAWLGVIALGVIAILLRKRTPAVAAGIGVLLLALLPYCGFISIYQGMAERFVYIAAIGFMLAIAAAAALVPAASQRILFALFAVWIAWGGYRLIVRVQDWQQPIALYQHSLQATPRSAYLEENLGVGLRDNGDQDNARAAFQRAADLKANYAGAIAAMADIDVAQGKKDQALAEYRHSLSIEPDDTKTILNYAAALQQTSRTAEAETYYKRVIALAPHDSSAYVDLESLYIQEDRHEDAIAMYKQAIAVNPNAVNAYFNMGVMFQQLGQDRDALSFYKKVLLLEPGNPQALLYMSKLKLGG